jgi:hypothetical protein
MAKSNRDKQKQERRRVDARKSMQEQEKGFEPTCIKLPEGMEFYKIQGKESKPGVYKVDVLPYKMTANNPEVQKHPDLEGMDQFHLIYSCHNVPRPDSEFSNRYVCRRAQWNKKCGVCKWLNDHKSTLSDEMQKELKVKTRMLMLVNDKPGDLKNPPKVFDTNYFGAQKSGFGEQLSALMAADEEAAEFWYPEAGKSLKLTTSKSSFGKGSWNPVTRIDVSDRKVQYPKDLADEMPNPEEFLIDPGFNEVWDLLESGGEKEEGDDDAGKLPPKSDGGKKTTTKPSSTTDDDEDEEDEDTTDDEDDSDEEESDDEDTDEEDSDEEEDEKPAKASAKKGNKLAVGDLVEYEDMECEIIHISGDGASLKLKDEEGEVYKGVSPDDVTLIKGPGASKDEDDEEEDDKPAPKKGMKSKASKDEDEDEEEDDDTDDESDDEDEGEDDSDSDEDEESDEDDTDDEDDEEEDEPAPKKGSKKPPAKPAGKSGKRK